MAQLKSDVAAINELLDSLGEEEGISKLSLDDGSVSFTLRSAKHGACPVTLLVEDPKAYPRSPALLLSEVDLPFLEQITAKLQEGARLSKAIRLLGAKLGLELDWVEEADGLGGSDAGSDQDEDMVDADDGQHSDEEDAELLREWSKCLTRWEAIERQHEAQAEEAERHSDASAGGNLDALSNKQIFDTKAAFRRLVNEMEEIFKSQDFNLVAEASGPDGLYTWNVSLAGFSPGSPLAQDMQQAGRKFGVSSVQLQLVFKRGLHPFYPPSVKLLAPRFQGPLLCALGSHPMLTTERWDPFTPAKEFLLGIKAFLEEHGRVDLESERNRMTGPSGTAYLETEQLLARLEALSGIPSVWRSEGHPLYKVHSEPADKAADSPRLASKKQKTGGEPGDRKVAFAKGTGYGYGHKQGAEVWDAKRAAAVQAARDEELRAVLSCLAAALSSQLAGAGASAADVDADVADCVLAVHKSCLAPLLVHQLCAASFQDMAARHTYYLALLECLDAVCNPLGATLLSWRSGEGEPNVAQALGRVQLQASHFVRVCGAGAVTPASPGGGGGGGAGRRAPASAAQVAAAIEPMALGGASTSAAHSASHEEEQRELGLAHYLLAVAKKAETLAKEQQQQQQHEGGGGGRRGDAGGASTSAAAAAAGAGGRTRGQRTAAAVAASAAEAQAAGAAPDADAEYRMQMSQHKVKILPGISATHSFRDSARQESVQPKDRLRRVGKELASCESDLPVHPDSSVFVVADEATTCLWKALIVGPKDTPYEGGCFIFDIYFPSDYPRVAPKVLLKTTGGGSVRFNPNLYNCGKVCLSLLGTWQGGRGESWDANVSTVLQVLVSIQSLIMVEQPFYNEPGYEQRPDNPQSDAYSANIMEQTVRWAMVDQLRAPPPYFKDIIQAHFRLRGDALVATCRRWADWCRGKSHPRHASAIDTLRGQLEAELAKL